MTQKPTRQLIDEYIQANGVRMSKKLSDGGLFSNSEWDKRKAHSLEDMLKLSKEGFEVNEDIAILLLNALIKP